MPGLHLKDVVKTSVEEPDTMKTIGDFMLTNGEWNVEALN